MLRSLFLSSTRRNVQLSVISRTTDLERCSLGVPFVRNVSTTINTKDNFASKHVQRHDWHRAVSEAEKIVGYPTSFLSLRWLLSDEIANVALHLRKLVGSNHPLLKTAKYLMHNGKNATQAWGLIVLLISKAAGHPPSIPDIEQDKSAGVLHSQRALAEITEMIRISYLIQKSVANLQPSTKAGQDAVSVADMSFGNKISLLSGDYLLAQSCAELANLRNQDLVELMLSAIRDFTESEFIGERDEQNNPIPSKPQPNSRRQTYSVDEDYIETDLMIPMDVESCMGIPEKEWALRHILSAGSLLGKSCQGALKLALQSEEVQRQGYLFGKHLSLAWQACLDAEPFKDDMLPLDGTFSLVSAPVLFHLEYDPSLYAEIEKGKTSVENIDYNKLHKEIMRGPGLQKTQKLLEKHTDSAMRVLEKFPPSDGRTALTNILLAMQDL